MNVRLQGGTYGYILDTVTGLIYENAFVVNIPNAGTVDWVCQPLQLAKSGKYIYMGGYVYKIKGSCVAHYRKDRQEFYFNDNVDMVGYSLSTGEVLSGKVTPCDWNTFVRMVTLT